MTDKHAYFASRLPGRIRIRDRGLRDATRHQALADDLAALEGLLSVEGNAAIGSLLVTYDVARMPHEDMEAAIAAKVEAVLGQRTSAPSAPASPERRQPMMRRLNTFSKMGMLASLAASMAAIGASKRLHAGTGAVYLAMMLIHVGVHRQRLFK